MKKLLTFLVLSIPIFISSFLMTLIIIHKKNQHKRSLMR